MIDLITQVVVPTPKNPLPAWPMLVALGLVAAALMWLWGKFGPAGKLLAIALVVAVVVGLVSVK